VYFCLWVEGVALNEVLYVSTVKQLLPIQDKKQVFTGLTVYFSLFMMLMCGNIHHKANLQNFCGVRVYTYVKCPR
jgi:hypothetical protein